MEPLRTGETWRADRLARHPTRALNGSAAGDGKQWSWFSCPARPLHRRPRVIRGQRDLGGRRRRPAIHDFPQRRAARREWRTYVPTTGYAAFPPEHAISFRGTFLHRSTQPISPSPFDQRAQPRC